MNVKLLNCMIVAAVLAVLGYFSLTFLATNEVSPLLLALAIFLSGVITPIVANAIKLNSNSSKASNSSASGEVATLYVGNLPYRANEEAVRAYFQDYINVQSVRLMKDKRTGKRKGYGFVEIISSDVSEAIDKLNDSVFQDRTLKVRHAKEKVAH
ncbi:RNA-binding protein [Alteromonas sp. ASW11-36]|uniref:RNA-binding protein n=1 Tax=Alteromonas arenosi TaxID=3055817 RepID=A0ABT7SZ36_9ALTE|nr:RNA-binding protein [Alteromonas sp. ASW11-36]MDM7861420.1 RNA-binding protein [Alteromonas sp. ASW11-36]